MEWSAFNGQAGSQSQMPQTYNNPGAMWLRPGTSASPYPGASQPSFQAFNPYNAYPHGYGPNLMGFGQPGPNQFADSVTQGFGASGQTIPNHSSNPHQPENLNSSRMINSSWNTSKHDESENIGKKPRKALLPTPAHNSVSLGVINQKGPARGSQIDYRFDQNRRTSQWQPVEGDDVQYERNPSTFNRDCPSGKLSRARYFIDSTAHDGRPEGNNTPSVSRLSEGNRQADSGRSQRVPDGASTETYPPPDVRNLEFDSSTGYRFDPTTGLHYDANSGLYLNYELKILLLYDAHTCNYVIVSNNAAGLAPPAVALLNKPASSSVVAGIPREGLKELARERALLLKPDTHTPDPYDSYGNSDDSDADRHEDVSRRRRDGRIDNHSWDAKRPRRHSPETWSHRYSPYQRSQSESQDYSRRPSSDYNIPPPTDRAWDDNRDPISFGGREIPTSDGMDLSGDRPSTIEEIHEHNQKNPRNLFGRYFPNPLPSNYILFAPVPTNEEMRELECDGGSVLRFLGSVLFRDKLSAPSMRVYNGGLGAPCVYALIRFHNQDDASWWYKLHQGVLDICKDPKSRYSTFMFFAEENWFCFKIHVTDIKCEKPTPNFPFRSLCNKCYSPRTKRVSPITTTVLPTNWVAILHLDCIKYPSVCEVLHSIPRHQGITIESTEYLREPSGLPIGVCVFKILDKEESSRFLYLLRNARFDASYVKLDKQALDFPQATPNGLPDNSGSEPNASSESQRKSWDLPPLPPPPNTKNSAGKRGRKKRDDLDPYASIAEELGGNVVVVDDNTEKGYDGKRKSEPFLRSKPVKQLIIDDLKKAVSLHTKNLEDPDNVLRGLFADPPVLRTVILLAPIPGDDRESIKKEIERILSLDNAACRSVAVYQAKAFGGPSNYALVTFQKVIDSFIWYTKHEGLLRLKVGADDCKSFMFFSDANWVCRLCSFINFPKRTWCIRCYANRDILQKNIVSECRNPSKYLGISSVGLPINAPESSFTVDNILAKVPSSQSYRVASCEMMLEDGGLPGLCVLTARNLEDAAYLRNCLRAHGWGASYLLYWGKPSSIEIKKSLAAKEDSGGTKEGNAVIEGAKKEDNFAVEVENASEPKQKSEFDNYIKYDPFQYILDNKEPCQGIILSPAPTVTWCPVEKEMKKLLVRDGVDDSCIFKRCEPQLYGSPHVYIHVLFSEKGKAISWYKKHNGRLELVFPETRQTKGFTFRMLMYYSEAPWVCRKCSFNNFPKRTLCHKCYAHRDDDRLTPATVSVTPTKWVGVLGLKRTISSVEQVKKSLPPLDSFSVTSMRLIKERNPMLNVGLCIIETPSHDDGQSLAEYINNYDARIRLVFLTPNATSEESSERPEDTNSIESSLSLIRSDDTLTNGMMAVADNMRAWWRNFSCNIEDTLKNLFQDQTIMPFPSDDTVFVPLPPKDIWGNNVHSKAYTVALLKASGVDDEVAEECKIYKGKNVGGPSFYTLLKFKSAPDAQAWRASHDGKWGIPLESGIKWSSFLHPCVNNWKCNNCNTQNFPLRLYCFWCYEPRKGGAPLVSVANAPTRFVGITKFQDWCASEEILFENMKLFQKLKDNHQLKKVHYPTEPSGIPCGLCVLEFENTAVAEQIFLHLIALTLKKHTIIFVEESSLI